MEKYIINTNEFCLKIIEEVYPHIKDGNYTKEEKESIYSQNTREGLDYGVKTDVPHMLIDYIREDPRGYYFEKYDTNLPIDIMPILNEYNIVDKDKICEACHIAFDIIIRKEKKDLEIDYKSCLTFAKELLSKDFLYIMTKSKIKKEVSSPKIENEKERIFIAKSLLSRYIKYRLGIYYSLFFFQNKDINIIETLIRMEALYCNFSAPITSGLFYCNIIENYSDVFFTYKTNNGKGIQEELCFLYDLSKYYKLITDTTAKNKQQKYHYILYRINMYKKFAEKMKKKNGLK